MHAALQVGSLKGECEKVREAGSWKLEAGSKGRAQRVRRAKQFQSAKRRKTEQEHEN
ncbi:MAG: hypothetical protein MJB12_10940 [Firmicutes bacterium]|nr:hypothetical protein [Bacillota bacterium]